MLYRPKLNNGEKVPLAWPIAMFRRINKVCWPLEDGASRWAVYFDRFVYIFTFLLFVQHNDAELRYLRFNVQNLDVMLTGMPTYLILIELHLRSYHLGLVKEQFKRFLQEFYSDIYIPQSEQLVQYQRIQRSLRPTFVSACLYLIAFSTFLMGPILNIVSQRKEMLYKMVFPFDHTPMYLYIPLILSNMVIGFVVTTMIFGEGTILAEVMLHLNGRFLMLRQDLDHYCEVVLKRNDAANIAAQFGEGVVKIIDRNVELYKFAAKVQDQFTFRIFILFSFSATLVCVLCFKVYTNPVTAYTYVLWMMAKILEMLVLGELGSTLIDTTDKVSSMYYDAPWEAVILRSSNTRENIRLMKLIVVAIETSQKPVIFTGFNFFGVSLTAVVKVLQGAGSYFTFLISFR